MGDITLTAFTEEHLAATFEWLQDAQLRRQIDSSEAPAPATHEQYWRHRLIDPNRPTFAIVRDGVHVGNCGLVVDPVRRKGEAWIYLGRDRAGGIGRVAVEQLLESAFDDLGLNRVFARVLATNEAALRFWRSLGFVEEGRLRADTWFDDEAVDAFVLSLLEPEWRVLTRT